MTGPRAFDPSGLTCLSIRPMTVTRRDKSPGDDGLKACLQASTDFYFKSHLNTEQIRQSALNPDLNPCN